MRVVLGADPLFQPPTGIGNYTRNLARNLLALQLLEELTLYANGAVFRADSMASLIDSPIEYTSWTENNMGLLSKLRDYLASREWALRAYQTVTPMVDRVRLHRYQGAVFHSPNYLLPAFDGPTVVTIHDLSIQRYPQYHPAERVRFLDARIHDAVHKATHIITDSTCVKTEILEHFGIDDARVTAIPLAAGEEFKPFIEEDCRAVLGALKIRYKQFFFFASTIEPRKNLLRICAAYKALRATGKTDWPIIFAGGAGWKSEAEHLEIQSLVQRGWAQYLGFVDAATLPILYSAAGALVFPSIYEGFGLPALEAQQSGTRVITSLGTSMAEFTSEHDVLVEPLEVDSLIAGMARAVELESLSDGSALPSSGSALSWQNTARLTADVYKQALGASP